MLEILTHLAKLLFKKCLYLYLPIYIFSPNILGFFKISFNILL